MLLALKTVFGTRHCVNLIALDILRAISKFRASSTELQIVHSAPADTATAVTHTE